MHWAPADPLVQARPASPGRGGQAQQFNLAAILAELLPENAIVSDESATSGGAAFPMCAGRASMTGCMLTGGAIGQGLPLAVVPLSPARIAR
jgi:acetolactate synthase-1/2/3 large subunit